MEGRFESIAKKIQNIRSGQLSLLITLPEELQLHILSFLTVPDLIRTSLVSRSLNALSQNNSLWKPHCEQKSLQEGGPVRNFKEQWALESAHKTPNSAFFSSTNSSSLAARCVLIGINLGSQNQLIKHYKADKNSEFNEFIFSTDCFVAPYPHATENKLNLIFYMTSEYLRILSPKISKAHCIFLLVDLEAADFSKAETDLQKIRSTGASSMIAILGVYKNQRTLTDEQLQQFALSNGIEQCEVVNLNQAEEVKTAINNVIAKLIKRNANMKVSAKYQEKQEEPTEDHSSKCLMM